MGLTLQGRLLPPEVQLLDDDRLAGLFRVLDHGGHYVADEGLCLMSVHAVGNQRCPPGVQVIARGVGLGHSQVVGI